MDGPYEFESWRSYWNFARSVSRDFRYVRTPKVEAFLATVLETSQSRRTEIPQGRLFWRAQLGHAWRPISSTDSGEIPCAHPRVRMKPLPDRAMDGRVNPRGIPCLYLATTQQAAMCEVRPWVGSHVSLGHFQTNRPLTVIDCSRRHADLPFHFEVHDPAFEPAPQQRLEAVWAHIDRAFAEPMTRSDDQADYAPTQILAELFKQAGVDGVVYKSNFGDDGFNVAIFDPEAADLTYCALHELKTVAPTFVEAGDAYWV